MCVCIQCLNVHIINSACLYALLILLQVLIIRSQMHAFNSMIASIAVCSSLFIDALQIEAQSGKKLQWLQTSQCFPD